MLVEKSVRHRIRDVKSFMGQPLTGELSPSVLTHCSHCMVPQLQIVCFMQSQSSTFIHLHPLAGTNIIHINMKGNPRTWIQSP